MTTQTEALKLALEALEWNLAWAEEWWDEEQFNVLNKAITAIKEALAQPEREPYAWEFAGAIFHDRKEVFDWYERGDISDIPPLALHTIPPQRTWVGLTDDEINKWTPEIHVVILAVEAKLKEKNT